MKRFFLASLGVALASACGGAAGSGTQISQSDMLGSTQAGGGNSNGTNAGAGSQSAATGQVGSAGGSDANGGSGNAATDQMGTIANGGRGGGSDTDTGGVNTGGSDAESRGGAGGVESAGASVGGMGVAGSGIILITAGASASAGAACTDSAPSQSQSEAGGGTVEATAGTFTDHCDENGDLVEYSCEVQYVQSPNCFGVPGPSGAALPSFAAPLADIAAPFCDSTEVATGNVAELVTSCAGRCEEAVCPFECPDYDELLTYVSIDRETGAAVFAFDRVGHDLSCELIFDRDTDDYSCITEPQAGREIVVPSLGINSRFCLEGNIGNIGVDDPTYDGIEECAYRCDVLSR